MSSEYYTTIGMDVSDRTTKVCVMSKEGRAPRVVMETTIPTTKEGLAKFLSTQDAATPVAFETGTHCRWMNEVAQGMGFKVYVANPCRLRMVTDSKAKNDKNDARMIARLALADPGLLHPVRLRGAEYQRMINLHEMRGLLVKQRSGIIVQLRAVAKSMGFRIAKVSAAGFHNLDRAAWPKELRDIAWPMLKNLEQLAVTIKTYDKLIRELAGTPAFKAQVDRLMEIHCVGILVATAFVAVTGGDMGRFEKPRDVGPWSGLAPKQDQSGDVDRQCHVTKAGSPLLTQDMRPRREDRKAQGRDGRGAVARGPDGRDAQEAGRALRAALGTLRKGAARDAGNGVGRATGRPGRKRLQGKDAMPRPSPQP